MKKNVSALCIVFGLIFLTGNLSSAFAQDRLMHLDPDVAMAHYIRGSVHLGNAEFSQAIGEFSSSISLRPDYYRAHFDRGIAHYHTNDFNKAIEDWEAVLRLSPGLPSAIHNIEVARRRLQEQAAAMRGVGGGGPVAVDSYTDAQHGGINITIHNLIGSGRNQPLPPGWTAPPGQGGPLQTEIRVMPGLPDPNSNRVHRLQVGTWSNLESASFVFRQLQVAGFHSVLEDTQGSFRVYITDVPASVVSFAVQRLGHMGFREVWVRD